MPVARAVVVAHLPGSRAAAVLQREDEVLLTLAADRPLTEVAEQLTHLMQGELDSRTWTQHWDGPGEPPQQMSRAS